MMSNKQKTLKGCMLLVLLLLIPSMLYAACTGSSPTWTCTADTSSVDLQACITKAAVGDTIYVREGTGTWNTRIEITSAVNLIGAGVGKTIINNTYAPSLSGASLDAVKNLITITPASPETNPQIRISGFTFNFGTTSYGILYRNNSTTYDCTNIRLDHLEISASAYVFQRYGLAHGVMDNCVIKGRIDGGGNSSLWSTNGYEYGTTSNFYIEDSHWGAYSNSSTQGFAQDMNGALRYAFRYNTVTSPTGAQVVPLFMSHGNQYGVQAGGFGMEIYGNVITVDNDEGKGAMVVAQRGGKFLVYNNEVTWTKGGATIYVHEEHQDNDGAGVAINPINGQPQHVSNSYYWFNTKNGAPLTPTVGSTLVCETASDPDYWKTVPMQNQDFWVGTASFDGTSGVGCGTLAKRPVTCIVGAGYWATNQSCSDLTGMVGVNPSTPISGTLYKCSSTNKWEPYYTPYTYPHPLRNSTTSYTDNTQEPAPTTSVPPTIAVSPTIKDFGTLPINTSSPAQRFTVTTTGGNLNVDAISMTGIDATQFTIQNDSCTGKIIAPETGSCTFDVKFAPSTVGAKAANVAIVDNDSNTSKLIAVNGTGTSQIPAISFSPTSLSFSNVLSGTLSSPQTINVSNNSANFATISSVSLSGTDANQFSIPAATDYCTGETVAASGNCSFQIIFAPTSGGEKTANVNLTALYYSNPATLPLYGSAVVYQSPVPRIKISKKK